MWDSQPLHSPARFTHAKEQTLRHLLEGKPPQSTQAGRVDAPQHPATSGPTRPAWTQQPYCQHRAAGHVWLRSCSALWGRGHGRALCLKTSPAHPPACSAAPYSSASPQATWLSVNWAVIWAGSWIWDLLQSNQPKVCHDVHNVCHGRSSQAATISSLVKHWNGLPGKQWNPHLWNYLRDVWTGH